MDRGMGPIRKSTKKSRDDIWRRILNESTSADDFLGRIRIEQPYEYLTKLRRLEYAARSIWPSIPEVYTPIWVNFPNLPEAIREWARNNISCEADARADRPISLILEGPSRTGKTEWARSLGRHNYFHSRVDFSRYDSHAIYNVIDNVPFKFLPSKTQLLGAKRDFTTNQRYRKNTLCKGGIPSIVLCNPDQSYREAICRDKGFAEWANHNVIFFDIMEPLF